MIIPLDKLVQRNRNIYELTFAIIKRAAQITVTGAEEVEKEGSKVVSAALKQVLTGKVDYRREE
ncbi:MAG: DNA-directed RNA polymerase subunit omega [Spirochaetales bacterium]|nr:DNA-directed RNA polymerase subunit omega [Spirochaetales bacterium]